MWDLRSGRCVMFLEGHLQSILSTDFSDDGSVCVCVCLCVYVSMCFVCMRMCVCWHVGMCVFVCYLCIFVLYVCLSV